VNAFVSHGRGTKPGNNGRTCYSSRRRLLRSGAEGLAFLRAVNPAEADPLRVVVVQDFKGVAVKDADYWAGEGRTLLVQTAGSEEKRANEESDCRSMRSHQHRRTFNSLVPSFMMTRRHSAEAWHGGLGSKEIVHSRLFGSKITLLRL
jgi:hypothetical protein